MSLLRKRYAKGKWIADVRPKLFAMHRHILVIGVKKRPFAEKLG